MFLSNENRKGTAYLEFSYCKQDLKHKNRYKNKNIGHFSDDSIFIYVDDMDEFCIKYASAFNNLSTHPNGSMNSIDLFGINYYEEGNIDIIIEKLSKVDDKSSKMLISWLEVCKLSYYGFYLLGI